MKPYTRQFLHAAGSLILALTLPADAARILFLDAAAPGPDPSNTWEDLSGSGYHFANDANPDNHAAYNDGSLSYDFTLASRMVGTGDESLFDFDTEFSDTPKASPFSIVAYFNQTFTPNQSMNILSKTDEPEDGMFTGWMFAGNGDLSRRFDFSMQPGNNWDRLYARTDSGWSGRPTLLVVTHSGGGVTGLDVNWYVDGQSVPLIDIADNLIGSVMNDNHLVIGSTDAFDAGVANGWTGSLCFLEVHATVLTPEEVAARWNGGDGARGGQGSLVESSALVPMTARALSFETFPGLDYLIRYADEPGGAFSTSSTIVGNGGLMRAYDTAPAGAARGRVLYFSIAPQ